jgi:hypothetical protein
MHDALDLRDLVADELAQRRETGYEVAGLEAEVELALRDGAAPLGALLDRLEQVSRLEDWPVRGDLPVRGDPGSAPRAVVDAAGT